MKKLMSLLFVVAVAFVFAVPSFAKGFSADNNPTPIFCDGANTDTVTVAQGSGLYAAALLSNPSRLDGYVLNISTSYLRVTFEMLYSSGTSTTDIDAGYFLLYPAGDSYNRDRINLKHENNVFRGPIYFEGWDLTNGVKATGKVSVWEWK